MYVHSCFHLNLDETMYLVAKPRKIVTDLAKFLSEFLQVSQND